MRPTFAKNPATAHYYDQRAAEYDEWYESRGQFAERDRPGWTEEVADVIGLVRSLEPARTIDVACGTGYLTQHLRGLVVGIDQSASMARIAQSRMRDGLVLIGDALSVQVPDDAFDRVFTAHFYGHLPPDERAEFLAESRRLADEIVIVDAAVRPDIDPELWQDRRLNDGSRHRVFKRYFTATQLAAEIGGEAIFDGAWFVAARGNLRG